MDIRDKLETKLEDYLVLYPNEKLTTQAMIDFFKKNQNCFERNNLTGHFTGSAWVLDESH